MDMMSHTNQTPIPLDKGQAPKWRQWIKSERAFWLFLLMPALIILFAVFIYPLLYSLYLSLTSYNLIMPPRFVGLRNYIKILSDPQVLSSIRVTLVFTFWALALELIIGFAIALILHDLEVLRDFFRTVSAIPLMMTPVVIGVVWRVMGNYDYGVFNYLLGLIGVDKMGWVINANLAMAYLIISDVWHTTGFVVLALSAGLAQLPQEMYEAAEVDGANFFHQLRFLTIPLLTPVFSVVIIFRLYNLIRMFDKAMSLTSGGPGHATTTMSFYIYKRMFDGWQVGYSSAVAIILMAITMVFCIYFIRKM
jgi:multiple sugar transport system permease protein